MSDAHRKPLVDAAESETLRMRGNSMHGNRETLETPLPPGEGRSGKASCRTPDMHVSRESDAEPGKRGMGLWGVHQWRERHARGSMIMIRYADDFVMGFQSQVDASGKRRPYRDTVFGGLVKLD